MMPAIEAFKFPEFRSQTGPHRRKAKFHFCSFCNLDQVMTKPFGQIITKRFARLRLVLPEVFGQQGTLQDQFDTLRKKMKAHIADRLIGAIGFEQLPCPEEPQALFKQDSGEPFFCEFGYGQIITLSTFLGWRTASIWRRVSRRAFRHGCGAFDIGGPILYIGVKLLAPCPHTPIHHAAPQLGHQCQSRHHRVAVRQLRGIRL